MSDGHAAIGYGFPVPKSLTNESEVDLEDLLDDNSLEFMWSGHSHGELVTFLIIDKSEVDVYTWQGGSKKFNPSKLVVQPNWDTKLKAWCKRHGVSKPKIGWYLCVTE